MDAKFKLGQLEATAAVAAQMREDAAFASFVRASLSRYIQADWGEMAAEDIQSNDSALANDNDRIFAAYTNAQHPAWKIWIITEWDHSATTVLFPSDY